MARASTWNELALAHWAGNRERAVVDDDRVVSGEELLRLAGGAAALFDDLGFGVGDAVPALIDETPDAIALAVGGALSRRPLAPLGTKLAVPELAGIVRGLGARRFLATPDRADLAEEVARGSGAKVHLLDRLLAPAEPLDGRCGPDDVVVIVHTSGTTGSPKPVFLRQAPMAARVPAYEKVMGIGPGDLYCSASPFYHTAGVAMTFTVLGLGVAVIPQDWFSIDNWRRGGRLGVTCSLLVPTMIDILLAEGALADALPRVLQYGASPIHPDTLTAAMGVLPDTRFLQIFGQTECSPICYLDHEDHVRALNGRPDLLSSVGLVAPPAELRVENPDAEGVGEIAILTDRAFVVDADGWRRTGDLGKIDEDGFVTLHGRLNDRIIRGGENIYPVEIETVLTGHPGVREVAIVGIPDRRYGEVVRAVVVPTDPTTPPDPEELRRLVAGSLAHFKVPTEVCFVDELPRNPSGKILRRQLKAV